MGVPRFYRWLAKRYPAFRCAADAGTQPHVDNLYLDLNGIVHQCARHDRGSGIPAAPDHEIFAEVFAEISAIVELVGPRKLLFLGLDGVAPRAKLNQQRARRFVAAKEKPQRDDYESAPPWFDGNCITPGTAFMHALGDALAFLVRKKMDDDSHWANLDVVLSTTAVPGEGEHKIMEYIRQRNDPPSTVHCAYGADADLILLALASHEPHFLVIREIPDYSGMRPVVGGPEVRPQRGCAAMEFISISVLRQYLRLDLCSPAAVEFFDIERAIDDFVLCSFLCGNDFLPHLPCVDIGEGALDAIVLLYRKMLPEWRDYLTLDGEIVMSRFDSFLQELSVLEPLVLGLKTAPGGAGGRGRRVLTGSEITSRVLSRVNSLWEDRVQQSGSTVAPNAKPTSVIVENVPKPDNKPGDWACPRCAVNNFAVRTECFKCSTAKPAVQGAAVGRDTETNSTNNDWVEQTKRDYYAQKLGFAPPSGALQRKLSREFLKGMAWTLKYYLTGCPSWGWFYPFHYAPFLSDMVNSSQYCVYELGFELGQPYTPLQQLLAVLPPGSAWALPGAYRRLMLEESSPIRDFYPAEFTQDANGKRNDWEATILLDFIDDRRLLAATIPVNSQLTPLEAARNRFALPLRFRRASGAGGQVSSIKSPVPELFPDIRSSVRCWQDRDLNLGNSSTRFTYKTELRPGAICVPPPSPSLPVLWHPACEVTGGLEIPGGVYVFGDKKQTKNSIVLKLLEPMTRLNDNVEAHRSLLGAVISINWPWQQLAVCTGLLAESGYIGDAGLGYLQFDLEKDTMLNKHRSERGLSLPAPKIIVYARPIRYAAEVSSGRPLHGTDDIVAYPLSCVGQVDSNDWRVAERIGSPTQVGAEAVVMEPSSAYFGGICQIITTNETGKCVARIERRPTASFAAVVARASERQGHWITIDELCAAVDISPSIGQQLVQDLHFRFHQQTYDVGLHFRFFKRGLLRAAFVRRKDYCMQGTLVYSPKATDYIKAYKAHVPELFDGLDTVEAKRALTKKRMGKGTAGQPFVAAELFGQDVAKSVLDRCAAFRDSFVSDIWTEPLYHNCSAVLGSTAVKELEGCLDAEKQGQVVEVEIDQCQLLLPGALTDSQHETLCGVSSPARAVLGSRVCYTMSSGPVRFGTTGTVVGIHPPANIPDKTSIGWTVDVIIQTAPTQQCAIGGSMLGGRCSALRGVSVPASHIINIGQDPSSETCLGDHELADRETFGAIKEQVEFYLSDQNLPKDSYFRPLVRLHPEGFVAISKFLSCNRIKQLTSDASLVAEACRGSEHLVVATDGSAIRRAQLWAPVQHAKQHRRRSDHVLDKRETAGVKEQTKAPPMPTLTADMLESRSRPRPKPPGTSNERNRSKRARRAGTRRSLPPACSALLAVSATIAVTEIPPQHRRHTVLALSIFPACLLLGCAAAESLQPTRKSIVKQTPPSTEVLQEASGANTLATSTALVSGIAVLGCYCAESLSLLYENPSVDSAMRIIRATGPLHENTGTNAIASTGLPALLASKPGAAVVALSLMPFSYVCGLNYLQ